MASDLFAAPISASGRCPAFPQEGCVTSPWANPKRRKLYHKLEVTECVYLKFWIEPPRSLWDPLRGKIANFMHIVIYEKVGSQHVFMAA